jgi:subtilisin family serine protease
VRSAAARITLAATVATALFTQPALAQPGHEPAQSVSNREQPKRSKVPGSPFYVTGQLIVGFKQSAAERDRSVLLRRTSARATDRIPRFGATLVKIPPTLDIARAMKPYERDPSVAWVVPNLPTHRDEMVPTDPLFTEQWGLMNVGQPHQIADPPPATVQGLTEADIDASDAWSTTTGSSETVIAIIDSGIEAAHPDLSMSLWSNVDELPGNGLDDDGNGYVDDTYGWDFIESDSVPQDSVGHGTEVAGVIAAAMNNGVGGSGVCPECRLMILRVKFVFQELAAIAYAIDNGADIINFSSTGDMFLLPEWLAFQAAYKAGVLSVVAAGNEAGNNDMAIPDLSNTKLADAPLFPASYDIPGILSVAASNDQDQYGNATGCAIQLPKSNPCFFTNFGHDSVDLAAPGVDILTTSPPGSHVVNGTSFSAPMVAGVAGLVKSVHPEYSVLQLRNAVLNAVDHPPDLAGGWTATSGRVNAATALAVSPTTTVPLTRGNIARAAPISRIARGRVSYPSNVNDVFKVRLKRGFDYGVVLDVPARHDYDLYVWKPGTVQIWQVEPGCDWVGPCRWLQVAGTRGKGKPEGLAFRARKSGIYYLQVTSWFSTGRYRLLVGRL